MKPFLNDNFLLQNKTAEILYHEHAVKMTIIDYHCHLDPGMIAQNARFENITRAWLSGDHYKWRAMRANGIGEEFITGNAPDQEKFIKWAETVPFLPGNPLFHWTHLELKRYFGISTLLTPKNAEKIYAQVSAMLQQESFSTRNLLERMKVEVVCTTDDPADDLEHHRLLGEETLPLKVLPAWRPDRAVNLENTRDWNRYLNRLSSVTDMDIDNYARLLEALKKRHDYFHDRGCRLSDHGLDRFYAAPYTGKQVDKIFQKVRNGTPPDTDEAEVFKSALLFDLSCMDFDRGWVQQFHAGALRNNNTRMFHRLGPDTGYDSIGSPVGAEPLSRFLDNLNSAGKLGKTILYNLHPADNEVMATMTGNFQDGSTPGKIQWGAAWWFLDQKKGIEEHLKTTAATGLLSRFVGMLTDSRSFLSYPRHEYFRRILCNFLGQLSEEGEIPGDKNLLGTMVENICYFNARDYFPFDQ